MIKKTKKPGLKRNKTLSGNMGKKGVGEGGKGEQEGGKVNLIYRVPNILDKE